MLADALEPVARVEQGFGARVVLLECLGAVQEQVQRQLFVRAGDLVTLRAGGEEARQPAGTCDRGTLLQQDLDRPGGIAALVEQRGQRGFTGDQGFGIGTVRKQPGHRHRLRLPLVVITCSSCGPLRPLSVRSVSTSVLTSCPSMGPV